MFKKLLLAAAMTVVGVASTAQAQVIGIATDQQGSLGYSSGQAVAKVAVTVAKLQARVQPMAGTAAYVPMINQGDMEFGFANAVEVEYAYTGMGNFEGKTHPNLRMVGVVFPLRTGIMVAADSGILSMADLKAKASGLRIASEYTASTIIKYYIMGSLANGGMTYDDFKQVPVSSLVAGMAALGDGQVDVALVSLNSAGGKEAEAKLQGRGGVQYISLDPSAEGLERFRKYLRAASIIKMPANDKIPGLAKEANIVEIPWTIFTHKDASDDLVHTVTKLIAENNAALVETLGAYRGWKKESMAPDSVVPYHPGALNYYQEVGMK